MIKQPVINREDFHFLMPPKRHFDILKVSFKPDGHISINPRLMLMLNSRDIRISTNKERTVILLEGTAEAPSFHFPESGVKKAETITRDFLDKGISLPAYYEVEWDEDNRIWVGRLVPPPAAPDPVALSQKLKRPGGKKEREVVL